jgi:hypothetical protein
VSPIRRVPIGDDGRELDQRQVNVIADLQTLARKWPDSLYLASMGGSLHVMRTGENGDRVYTSSGALDPAYSVDTVPIENTGGDW